MKTTDEYFSQLYKKYHNSLYRFGMGMGLSHDVCLDVINDIFCGLIEKNVMLETNSIKHYLFRCFINRHINIRRSRRNEISGKVKDLPFELESSIEDTNIEGYMIEQEEMKTLKNKVDFLLGLLTQRQRKAIYLRFMEEMEYDEIGKLLDINIESVRMLVFRGLEKMRNHGKVF